MNSGSGAPPEVTETREGEARRFLRWKRGSLKYILAVVIVAYWFGSPLSAFAFPWLSDRLLWIILACLLVLFVLSLNALFRRRWKEIVIFFAIWPVVLFPLFGSEVLRWLYVEAFRVHASPIEEYLSRCELFEFIENGVKHVLGRCESTLVQDGVLRDVFYDTPGEFILPPSQRTPEWKGAMGHFDPRKFLLEQEGRADKLFGNFYEVIIPNTEWTG
jgi:hypothetical protein